MKSGNWFAAVAALLFCTTADAAVIVDTGAFYCASGAGTQCGGSPLSHDESLAAKFSLQGVTNVTDIFGWMNTDAWSGNSLTIALYGDGGQLPDTSQALYSSAFSILRTGTGDGYRNEWQGLSGINWLLNPGSYWIAFEVRPGQDYSGYMPTGEFGAPKPLSDEAFFYAPNGGWLELDSLNLGLRVSGDLVTPVPIPATVLLFGSALLPFGVVARRRNPKAAA